MQPYLWIEDHSLTRLDCPSWRMAPRKKFIHNVQQNNQCFSSFYTCLFWIACTSVCVLFSLFNSMEEEIITNTELFNATYDENAFYHVAFQPKYPNYTFTRACVTVRPPPTTEIGDEHRVCDRFIVTTIANCCLCA